MVKRINTTGCAKAQVKLAEWENQTPDGFGTCYVLGAKIADIRLAMDLCKKASKEMHGIIDFSIVHDPTYPIKDGEVFHSIPLDTCAYIFGKKQDIFCAIEELNLELMK
jgi:hypothetical protein